MTTRSNSKLKLLYLIKILDEQSDENHKLSTSEIIQELRKYDIHAERKSIYRDIDLLQSYGLDIGVVKSVLNHYYLASRNFELAELKLLIDAVQSSKFITLRKSEQLIRKIQSLTSKHEAKSLQRQVIVQNRVKTINESIYYHVDKLHKAIQSNHLVQFKYTDYTLDKRQYLRRDGEIYIVSPYALSWAEENYYLIAYHDRYAGLCHFRVDRMVDLEITDEKIPHRPEFKQFNIVEYSKKMFQMYSGDPEHVELEFDASLINVVIDRFGREVHISKRSEQSFHIRVEVTLTPTFLSWLFMFGNKVKIHAPAKLLTQMKEAIQQVGDMYRE